MTFRFLYVAPLVSLFSLGVSAQEVVTNASNTSTNVQSNSGAVTLSPMGGSNANYQINSVSNSQYGFAPGIQCPTPELALGAFGGESTAWASDYNNGGNNIGGTILFTMPLGGDTAKYCKQLAFEIAKQRRLDTEVNMIRQCAQIANAGIQIDVKAFPDFAICSGVIVEGGKTAVLPPPTPFTPTQKVVPVIEVGQPHLNNVERQVEMVGAN